jgi:GT2 family glycosyltransferase
VSGVIGVACADLGRYSQFSSCLANLVKPEGTEVVFEVGIDVAINRRNIVRRALETNVEWVFFVDDDMLFGPAHLWNLLAHNKPIVASLYLNRKPPYYPVAYNRRFIQANGDPAWNPVDLEGAPASGLVDIVAAGTGGLLVRTRVFAAMPFDSWFRREGAGEDMSFCHRAIEAGFPIYLDLAARMGHISNYSVWPMQREEHWSAGIGVTEGWMLSVELGPGE